MAFRAAAMRVGAGSAGAAVAGPAASHCYSRPSARPGQQREEGWCIPRFEDSTVLFSDEEVDNTINIFLGLPEGTKACPTVVTEVGGSQSDDESSVSSGANFHMEEADNMTLAHNDMRSDFGRTLQGLLKNSEVQRACMNALRDDPAFSDMLARLPEAGSLPGRPLEMTNLLPPAVQIVEVGDASAEHGQSEDPFKDFLDGLADRAKGVGEQIKRSWDSVGNGIGQALIRFGLTIHNILGRPFQQQPQYPEQSEWAAGQPEQVDQSWFQNPDAVGKVVIKVACCIVALMVFRRVVRF